MTRAKIFSQIVSEAENENMQAAFRLLASLEDRATGQSPKTSSIERELIKTLRLRFDLSTPPRAPALIEPTDEGISLVTCAMNRTENLLRALPTWLSQEEIREIIIVDWCSDIEIQESLEQAGVSDPRILIIRAENEPRWILSYAFNLGFRYARYDKVLKVDADITLGADFFTQNLLEDDIFISGFWETAEKGQEHINGFFYVKTEHLGAIMGFNEFITTYGWDDDDIYARLSALGLERRAVDNKTIYHLEHDDQQRLSSEGNSVTNALEELTADTMFCIRRNRYLAFVMPSWRSERRFVPFEVLDGSGPHLRVRRLHAGMPHLVSDDQHESATLHAAMELLSWRLGPQIYHLPHVQFFNLLRSKRLDEITKQDISDLLASGRTPDKTRNGTAPYVMNRLPKIFVDAQHGLGNRLRAIASAAAIAEASQRELVIVWQSDHHCECEMRDLFEHDGPVIEQAFVRAAPSLGIDTYNYMESEGGEKDKPIHLGKNDVYLRSAFVAKSDLTSWEAENRFLKSLRPVESVRDLVSSFDLRNHIGAHIRMEGAAGLDTHTYETVDNWTKDDHELLHFWREKSNPRHFIKHIDGIFESEPEAKLFLATDMQETYDAFRAYYGDRVKFLERRVYDRSKEQLVYALADALLLSKCKRLLGSTWSSFSEIAVRISDGFDTIEMSGEDF